MEKKTVINFILTTFTSILLIYLAQYLNSKTEDKSIEKAYKESIIKKFVENEKKYQKINEKILNNEIERNKLYNAYKFAQQSKINDIENEVEKCHLEYQWLESRYRKADKKIIERFRRKSN